VRRAGALLLALLLVPGLAHAARTGTWTLNSTDETSVELERAVGACALFGTATPLAFVNIATLPHGTTTYFDQDTLVQKQAYCFRVRACNAAGCSDYSNLADYVEPGLPVTPAALTISASPWTLCAPEDGTCTFTGTRAVRFGAGTAWSTRFAQTSPVPCNNATFGDPAPSVVKHCEVQ
jgi:hypothetical protein